mmetsp:Transcript_38814/g.86335  ORF Transcript_38814/g.86335 Transcript_38814/m.86335 type:complete len:201 (-) Transcript_38814:144-746(-)|eukprot:CAMPEP_0202919750 /NCGR_PEP_ID=MMETSP1392-20130828/76497_1 /ASSEMBLY_ACC=CAM_ASM_000868 /TAXON_ID=225041 /ORGANISM="Chlamydomonas chlamydogama, Strain SAG 11-48b" /LENGTH=200 /DNA_ID=CAMNT_0049613209 /DNA_START=143 /DNA_END=745 /DNA_ORIENTATION=-
MGCPCYWGCGTTSNKVVWAICIFFIIAGGTLLIAGGAGGADHKVEPYPSNFITTYPPLTVHAFTSAKTCWDYCYYCLDVTDSSDTQKCIDISDDMCKYKTWAALVIVGSIVLVFGGICPTFFFCCCSQPPQDKAQATTVAMGHTQYAAPPHAQPMYAAPPPVAQPMYPPPQGPQPAAPAPAQPPPANYYPAVPAAGEKAV